MKRFAALIILLSSLFSGVLTSSEFYEVTPARISNEGTSGASYAATLGIMSTVGIEAGFSERSGAFSTAGAGVIYRLSGERALIITNSHVVCTDGKISSDIKLFLFGREDKMIPAEYVGGSESFDVAVLAAEDSVFLSESVRAVDIDDSDMLSVGEAVVAVGNPTGAGIAATLGIISVASEYITVGAKANQSRVIRIDAAINSGNSGGGIFNSAGRLLGIVNAKIVDAAVENIGYAIPISTATAVADKILEAKDKKQGRAPMRASLGVTLSEKNTSVSINGGTLGITSEVTVEAIKAGSPADGILKTGDEILTADLGKGAVAVTRLYHLTELLIRIGAEDTLTLTVKRAGKLLTVRIKITESTLITL